MKAQELYLDLLKRSLLNLIYEDHERRVPVGRRGKLIYRPLYEARMDGSESPLVEKLSAYTMVGMHRLSNAQFCVESVLEQGVPGDLVETGVWRGGVTILMKGVLEAYEDDTRRVWVADSFAGLPPPNPDKFPADKGIHLEKHKTLAISLDEVRSNFARYNLLDERVRFLKGLFQETLPTAPIEQIAVLRLDGDLYESTIVALENLYPKVSPGGYVIVDDYGAMLACRQAVMDYRKAQGIDDPILPIDWTGVYWQRGA